MSGHIKIIEEKCERAKVNYLSRNYGSIADLVGKDVFSEVRSFLKNSFNYEAGLC